MPSRRASPCERSVSCSSVNGTRQFAGSNAHALDDASAMFDLTLADYMTRPGPIHQILHNRVGVGAVPPLNP